MIENLQELTGDVTPNQELTGQLDLRETGGKVNDVLVNGTSVVTNKVANIDLTGKQDLLVSGTNIKTINNTSILGEGNITIETQADIPSIYFAKLTAIFIGANSGDSANTTIVAQELTEYNEACVKANQFIPLCIMANDTQGPINFYFYPRIRFNGKLQYQAYGYKNNGFFYRSETQEISDPVIGSLTTSNLTFTTITKRYLNVDNNTAYTPTANYHPATKKYVDDIVGDIESLLGGI